MWVTMCIFVLSLSLYQSHYQLFRYFKIFSELEFYPASQGSSSSSQNEHQHFSGIYRGSLCFFVILPHGQKRSLISLLFQHYSTYALEISVVLVYQCFSLVCPLDQHSSLELQNNQHFFWLLQLHLCFSTKFAPAMVSFLLLIWIFWDVVGILDRVPDYSGSLLWAIKVHISLYKVPTIACHESNRQPHHRFPE